MEYPAVECLKNVSEHTHDINDPVHTVVNDTAHISRFRVRLVLQSRKCMHVHTAKHCKPARGALAALNHSTLAINWACTSFV